MQSKFHVGQKIICKSNFNPFDAKGRPLLKPEKGIIYTVRGHTFKGGLIGLYLEEIINKPALFDEGFSEPSFWEEDFAPISNIKVEWSELANKELVLN